MNYRFSQSGRTERNRQDHLYPENLFPFANVSTTDPHTGKTDSRYAKCQATNTCPLGVEIYSANEYWVKTASLLHTTPDGSTDLPDSPFTRNYFMTEHAARHRQRNEPRKLPAVPESVELEPGAARAVPCVGQVVHRGDTGA